MASNDFPHWLSSTASHYLKLNDSQKNEALNSLISLSGPTQLLSLTEVLPNLLFRDFVSHLPSELLFTILKHLDVPDLLSCCQVSRRWKMHIESLVCLWSHKAKEFGIVIPIEISPPNIPLSENSTLADDFSSKCSFDEDEDVNHKEEERQRRGKLYKSLYVKALKLVNGLKTGSSLNMKPNFITGSRRINSLMFHGDHLFIGNDNQVQIRSVPQGTLVSSISTHSVCDMTIKNSTIYTASFNSNLESWDMNTGMGKNVFWGHTSAVLCVDVSDEETFVLTGSADKTAKLWSQSGGNVELLITLSDVHRDWVFKVKFLSCQSGCIKFITCDTSLIQIWWFDVKTRHIKSQGTSADAGKEFISFSYTTNDPSTLFAIVWSETWLTSQLLIFDIKENGLKLNDQWCITEKMKLYILAVGVRFMLVMCSISRKDFFLLDLKRKLILARMDTPDCLLTRNTSTVVVSDTSWLDGFDFKRINPGVPLFAACINRHSIILGLWSASLEN